MRAFSTVLALSLFALRSIEGQQPAMDAITGAVSDSTGAPVPYPVVRVLATGTTETRTAQSFANGRFVLVWVGGNGKYTVSITAPGFQRVIRPVRRTGTKPLMDIQVKLKSGSGLDTIKRP